jgi:hypothetical protein
MDLFMDHHRARLARQRARIERREREAQTRVRFWNVSTRKVGGLRFIKIGRLTISISVSKSYRSL